MENRESVLRPSPGGAVAAARAALALALAAAIAPLSGCGAGTAAAVSSGGGGSGGDTPPAMSGFAVLDPKLPNETRVRFVLTDAEANPAEVTLHYQIPGHAPRAMTAAGQNPATLSSSSQGVEHVIEWDFAAEPDLPDDARFVEEVMVFAELAGGVQEFVLGANAVRLGLGNDAPEIDGVVVPAQETSGIVGVQFEALDTSSDVVSIRIEYDLLDDDPDLGWRPARPALADDTPEFAVANVLANRDGTPLSFFWDTDVDLADGEHDVRLRLTARDPVVEGGATASALFRVDNNAEPIVTVSDGQLLLGTDARRGIPVPYVVRDEESDPVELVFQWKRPGESYPPLPATRAEIHALLADEDARRAHRICSELPTWVEGHAVPVDATSLMLPELATTATGTVTRGLVGRELEILRAPGPATPVVASWASNPLAHPVAVLPIGDGLEALVLDRASAGAWRLRTIELASGTVTREIVVSAAGEPDAIAFERLDPHSVLVSSDVAGAWSIERVSLSDGERTPLFAFDGTVESGAVRGIASQSRNTALVTVGSSLVRVDFADRSAPSARALFDDLATPWGVAVDPADPEVVYVAEHDAPTQAAVPGRIVVLDLARAERRTLALAPPGPAQSEISAPQSIAFDASTGHLLVVQAPGAPEPATVHRIVVSGAAGTASVVSTPLAGEVGGVAGGPERLITIALTGADDVALSGGVEQRRVIRQFEQHDLTVRVDRAFLPAVSPQSRWRVRAPSTAMHARPDGARGLFVWDSADVPSGGTVQLRAAVLDAERGLDAVSAIPKTVKAAIDADPHVIQELVPYQSLSYVFHSSVATADLDADGDLDLVAPVRSFSNGQGGLLLVRNLGRRAFGAPTAIPFPGFVLPTSVATGDLDGDGDVDLAAASYERVYILFQTSPGVFGDTVVLTNPGSAFFVAYVALADLDQDGDLDVAATNQAAGKLVLFFQSSPGAFGPDPELLEVGGAYPSSGPRFVTPADVDGDGDVDLLTGGDEDHIAAIFFQTAPGVFATPPTWLGGAPPQLTNHAIAADLDHDGDLDIAAANFGTARVFYQTSQGAFAEPPLVLLNPQPFGSFAATVAALDCDDDGDFDLALGSPSTQLTVYFQDDSGVLDPNALVVRSTAGTLRPIFFTVADLDGDERDELVGAPNSGNELTISYVQRAGEFSATPVALAMAGPFDSPAGIAAGDLDRDGDLDLVAANLGSRSLDLMIQSGPGVFSAAPRSIPVPATNGVHGVTAADIDGDGNVDLVASVSQAKPGDPLLYVFLQRTPGNLDSVPIELAISGQTGSSSVIATDLDGDRDLDLVAPIGRALAIFFQQSPGVFASTPVEVSASPTSGFYRAAAADIDGDGDTDLVAASSESRLEIYFQTSAGEFSKAPATLGGPGVTDYPQTVTTADIDGDGDTDVVTTCGLYPAYRIAIFFQTSAGTFDPVPRTLANPSGDASIPHVTTADLDRDGDLDLVSASYYGAKLQVYFQSAAGVFDATPMPIGGPIQSQSPSGLIAADLDGDGDPDLAVGDAYARRVNVFWNSH